MFQFPSAHEGSVCCHPGLFPEPSLRGQAAPGHLPTIPQALPWSSVASPQSCSPSPHLRESPQGRPVGAILAISPPPAWPSPPAFDSASSPTQALPSPPCPPPQHPLQPPRLHCLPSSLSLTAEVIPTHPCAEPSHGSLASPRKSPGSSAGVQASPHHSAVTSREDHPSTLCSNQRKALLAPSPCPAISLLPHLSLLSPFPPADQLDRFKFCPVLRAQP